jgi:hypothetical protein
MKGEDKEVVNNICNYLESYSLVNTLLDLEGMSKFYKKIRKGKII